jgi:hypothetical protein
MSCVRHYGSLRTILDTRVPGHRRRGRSGTYPTPVRTNWLKLGTGDTVWQPTYYDKRGDVCSAF